MITPNICAGLGLLRQIVSSSTDLTCVGLGRVCVLVTLQGQRWVWIELSCGIDKDVIITRGCPPHADGQTPGTGAAAVTTLTTLGPPLQQKAADSLSQSNSSPAQMTASPRTGCLQHRQCHRQQQPKTDSDGDVTRQQLALA